MGQGFKTSLRKICAATLGVSIDQIEYLDPDTSKVVDSGPTAASRSTRSSDVWSSAPRRR